MKKKFQNRVSYRREKIFQKALDKKRNLCYNEGKKEN